MKEIKKYESYNGRRYGKPWVAIVNEKAKIDFSTQVGGYTGRDGEPGQLYISDPIEGQVYAYGQKDYRGNKGGYVYIKYLNGEFIDIPKDKLLEALKQNLSDG